MRILRYLALLALALWPPLMASPTAAGGDCPAPAEAEEEFAPLADANGRRIGLALGSGSMHGLAHVGVIRELEARGVPVHIVAGSSIGAVVGSLWASGLSGAQIEELALRSDWEHQGRLSLSLQGFLSNEPMRSELARIFEQRPMETWPRRFGAVATHLADGSRRALTRGDGALAVQASTAVPVIYQPVAVDGEKLADGALVEPIPVDLARELGADTVIAVDVAYRPYEESANGLAQFAFQSMHILINTLGARQLQGADVAIRLDMHRIYVRCGRAATIAAGREAVRRAWPRIVTALAAAPERRAAR